MTPFVTILITICSGAIGFFIRYVIDKRKEINTKINEERRQFYLEFVNIVIDLLDNTKTEKTEKTEKKDLQIIVKKLYGFYKKYVLYASPKVINAFGDYFQYLFQRSDSETNDSKVMFQYPSLIMKEMRSDLGLSNRGLGSKGELIFRAMIKDFDSVMK